MFRPLRLHDKTAVVTSQPFVWVKYRPGWNTDWVDL